MGIFTARGRPAAPDEDPAGRGVPPRFEAVAEALQSTACPLLACEEVGRDLALDGVSVAEALESLRTTWRAARSCDPTYEGVVALARAWSEATLAVVNDIGCEDPMTGLATVAHLRTSVSALFHGQAREGRPPRDSHALVVLAVGPGHGSAGQGRFTLAMRLASLGEAARTVFAEGEVVAHLGPDRVVVLTSRDGSLGSRVRLLRRLVEGLGHASPRVWIEGLPTSDLSTGALLDELARA